MVDEPEVPDDENEDGSQYLTLRLERKFERAGYYLVEQQVLGMRYTTLEKRQAAMYWLRQQRDQREQKERRATRRMALIGVVGAIVAALGGALGGAYVTGEKMLALETRRTVDAQRVLVETLTADIEATLQIEAGRKAFLEPHLQAMAEKDSNAEEGGRPWLMTPVPSRFPVFEANAGRLGLLGIALATQVAQFYGLGYELRAHIALVTSPPLIKANRREQIQAANDYRATLAKWQDEAQSLLSALR